MLPISPPPVNGAALAGLRQRGLTDQQIAKFRFYSRQTPVSVRHALAAARRRYHTARLTARPDLADPRSYVGLFLQHELLTLAQCGYWPLPAGALDWLAVPPRARAVRRRDRQVADVVRAVLTDELPAAVDYLIARWEALRRGTPH